MKKSILFFATFLLSLATFAQLTQGINYQAVARDASNNVVASQPIGLRLSILSGSAIGTAVYTETHQITADANGIINLTIGQGTSANDFTTIDWGVASHFLKTEMDITGGASYVTMGTMQFATVPYALHAQMATNIVETQNLNNVLSNDNRANTQIKELVDPTDAQDAATKAYVDLLKARIAALEPEPIVSDGFEPNNSKVAFSSINEDQGYNLNLENSSDVDVFNFNLAPCSQIKGIIKFNHFEGDIDVRSFSPNSTTLLSEGVTISNDEVFNCENDSNSNGECFIEIFADKELIPNGVRYSLEFEEVVFISGTSSCP